MAASDIDKLVNADRFKFKPSELRAKYREERDKRLRNEGNG